MKTFYPLVLLMGMVWYSSAFPSQPETLLIRPKRFTDRNQYNGPNTQQEKKPDWEIKPDLSRDQRGNTRGQVTVENHGRNHDVEAGWGQNIRGPDKHSGTWHVGGSVRW